MITRVVAFDCETHLIRTGMLFPRLVCVSVCEGGKSTLYDATDGVRVVLDLLRDPSVLLVGHNVAYDLGIIASEAISQGHIAPWVMRWIFEAYAADRITDTMIRAMLYDIADGKFQEIEGARRGKSYALSALAKKWCDIVLEKEDTWRLHYAALQHIPLDQWPKEAREYSLLDSEVTLSVHQTISAVCATEGRPYGDIPDEYRQARAAWVLHLASGWGPLVDQTMVREIRQALELELAANEQVLTDAGLYKSDKRNGRIALTKGGRKSKNLTRLRELIVQGYASRGETPPTTDKGQVSTSADAALESGHPACMAYANCAKAEKLLSTYLPALERAGDGPLTSSPNVLVASGRTSWTNPNLQNPPQVGGIRECMVPRAGRVFVGADLDTVELRALAQTCLEMFGFSEMAAALIRGEDLHSALGADLMGTTYQQFVRLLEAGDPTAEILRQLAKRINFGLPGGMGIDKFAATAEKDGQPLDSIPSEARRKAQQYKEAWFRRWPEMRQYLQRASETTGDWGSGRIVQPWSGRVRGGLEYCAAANTLFQGRVADGAKLALWRLAWAMYVDTDSVLYGSRLVFFLHDEVILECPEEIAHECAQELVKILCGAVQEVIPDVPITSKPVVMRRFLKGAKPVHVNGRLVPGRPEVLGIDAKTGKKKVKWVPDALAA